MEPASRGEHSPIAENTTQDGKKKNRRVEIVVIMPKGRR
jgi:outer membrane protein OmpA-like peptidoglycan-associated protein